MAYACPVCAEPQVDAGHLADHVAFTAITGDEAHETWLDETVAEWGDLGQSELAAILIEHAEETEFPLDLDESEVGPETRHTHDHGEGAGMDRERGRRGPPQSRVESADDEDVQNVLDEARDMTRRMRGDADETDADGDTSTGDGDESDNETQ